MKDPRETAWFLSRESLPAPGLQAASECVVPSPHFCYLWTEEAELRKSGTSRQDMDIEGLEFTPEQLPTFMLWAGSSNPHPSLAVGSFLLSWKPPLPTHPSSLECWKGLQSLAFRRDSRTQWNYLQYFIPWLIELLLGICRKSSHFMWVIYSSTQVNFGHTNLSGFRKYCMWIWLLEGFF